MGSSSSFDDYSSSPAAAARGAEMCMEIGSGGGRGRRRSTAAAADGGGKINTKQNKQPQRGLGVAQLEKIRLHNQMLAAYRSAAAQQQQQMHDHHHHHAPQGHDVDATAASAATMIPAAGSSFQHLTNRCFEEETDHDHRGVAVHYYDGLLPYSSRTATTTPSLYAHDVRDSAGHRLGQPPQQQQQQHYWMMSSRSDGTSAEELDLELRL